MIYDWLTPKQHMITVRDREGFPKQYRYWNNDVIKKVLAEQNDTSDIYISKYPSSRLVSTVILDFDSQDINEAYDDVNRMRNYLEINGLNSVIVFSGSKGYHLYIEIAPFLFADTEIRNGINWKSYFNAFVCFLIHDGRHTYKTLDKVNFSAGLNGNIRLIGSKHPVTHEVCEIIEGSFKSERQVTRLQDEAQKKAYCKLEIVEDETQQKLKRAKVIKGNDPIKNNDLRDIFRQITGDMKLYPKGYGYCSCPYHGRDEHFSLLVTKEWFSCSACTFRGNIWTLRKLGLVDFGDDGVAKL